MNESDSQIKNPQIKSDSIKTLFPILSNSISNLSGSSTTVPSNKDFHFYFNFQDFKNPVQDINKKSQKLLENIGACGQEVFGKKNLEFSSDVNDDEDVGYDWLVNFNDEVFERFDVCVDEFKKIREKDESGFVKNMSLDKDSNGDDGFQLVGRKKKEVLVSGSGEASLGSVKVVGRESNVMGTPKAKVPFHIASIRRPQDEYKILVNNTMQPFEHVWLERSEDGSRFIHPLEKLSVKDFIDITVSDVEPVKPPPVESTSFTHVQDVKSLKELAAKLRAADEFAVDLEHNHYRSFQGLTCLMQISTRTEDFIVDTLKLRVQIGPYLREVFKDPTKRKVMHGADRDIIWLQRDFGIYVCNMFDTGQASRVLNLERNSLEYLLRYYCEVAANKEYQNADWRLRPLTNEMLRYAREDTHYLLYIYDVMKRMLLSSSTVPDCPEAPLLEVYQRSNELCMQLYQKDILTENTYLGIYGLHSADFSGQQLAIVAGLCEWRDIIARSEDESTGYILPNKALIEIAKQMPVTPGKLRHVLKARHPYIERNLGAVVGIIRHSMQNAAAFEPVAKRLKEEYVEMMAARNAANGNGEEAAEVVGSESISKAAEGDSFEKEVGNFIAGANQNIKLDGPSASRVSIEVQKKPSRAFGAMFGNTAGKRKFNPESKATEEITVEKIKSSVSLPFRSFPDKTEPSHIVVKEPAKPEEIPVLPMETSSKTETDIILLESESEMEDEKPESTTNDYDVNDNDEKSEQKTEDDNNVIMLDSDSGSDEEEKDGEGNMSLTNLSSSFQKCVQTADEKMKSNQAVEGGSGGLVKIIPFDYAAARREASIGEDGSDGSGGEDGNSKKGKREKKKASGRKNAADERSGDFQLGRRRQAFPASGNRSSTFR